MLPVVVGLYALTETDPSGKLIVDVPPDSSVIVTTAPAKFKLSPLLYIVFVG